MPCGRHARPASPGRAISFLNGRRCALFEAIVAGSTRPAKPRARVGPQLRVRLLSPRSLVAALLRSYTGGSRAAGPGGEECGSEEQLGPGEIGQFFLHGYANRLPWTAHGPLIYGGERPHDCGSELRYPSRRVVGNLEIQHSPSPASGQSRGAVDDDLC